MFLPTKARTIESRKYKKLLKKPWVFDKKNLS